MGRETLPGGPPPSLTHQRSDLVVFACGDSAHAEHDSVAIAACIGLPADVLERIDLKISGPMRPEYLRDLSAGSYVVIADTVPAATGELVEVPFADLVGRDEPLIGHSTPDQPVDEVVAMADLLRSEPLRGRFIALAVGDVDLSRPPDPDAVRQMRAAVSAALDESEDDSATDLRPRG